MTKDVAQRHAEQLQQLRKRIFLGLARLDEDLRQIADGRESEQEDTAAEAREAEVLSRLDERSRHEIEEIDDALLRIAAGGYGRCKECGQEISSERLAALPATPFCFSCATELDPLVRPGLS